DDVAVAAVSVDDNGGLRSDAVAVHDVIGDAVERVAGVVVLSEVGVQLAVAVQGGDVVHDGGGDGRDGGVGDALVPGAVGREELLAQQRRPGAVFEGRQPRGRP